MKKTRIVLLLTISTWDTKVTVPDQPNPKQVDISFADVTNQKTIQPLL